MNVRDETKLLGCEGTRGYVGRQDEEEGRKA